MKFKQLNEKATSVAQQRLMALALQHKRGELPADKVSPAVKDLAKGMSEKDLEDFAKTKHKGLPDKVDEAKDPNEYDNEGEMAKTQLKTIMRNAEEMMELLDDEENMPEWVQNKITKASDYMTSAYNYMASEDDDEVQESVNEVGFQGAAATATRVAALGAIGGAAYAAKKARDRFDPVKVAKARREREERKRERQQAQKEIDNRKRQRARNKPARRPAG